MGGRMKNSANRTLFDSERSACPDKKKPTGQFFMITPWWLLGLIVWLVWVVGYQGIQAKSAGQLELIHADLSRGTVVNGRPLRFLEGHVHIRQDSLELFCQRATYDEQAHQIILEGEVLLIRGTDSLRAQHLTYFEISQIAIAEKNVELRRPNQFMQCDYLEYHYQTDRVLAQRHLWLNDASNRVFITGRKGEYLPEKEYAYIRHQAHLWRLDSTATDTLHIFARELLYRFGERKSALARDSVNIRQGELTATCDSAVYLVREDVVRLMGNPHALYRNNEMFGKTMELVLDSLEVRQVRILGDALAISIADSVEKKENRLAGKQIVMYISQRQLQEIRAINQASSQYYLEENGETRGVNVASADTIRAFFTEGELDSIAVMGGAEGTYYPENYQGEIR